MNSVSLIGRLTKEPEVRYTQTNKAVASFTLAVDRGDKERNTDFIRCIAFDKTAEILQKFVKKGQRVGIVGSIRTGSYQNQKGDTVYTTDINVNRLDLIEPKNSSEASEPRQSQFEGFEALDDDIPFF